LRIKIERALKELTFKEKIIRQIILFHYEFLNFILNSAARILFSARDFKNAKNILVFRTGSLGDSVCALPALYSIRKNFPDARIDILTNAGAENLVSLENLIQRDLFNNIINYLGKSKKELLFELGKNKYDLFIELPQNPANLRRQLRNIFVAKSLRIRSAFGWEIASTRFLPAYQAKLVIFINERERLLNILKRNGLQTFGICFPLGITEQHRNKVEEIIKEYRLDDVKKNVGLVPGAKRKQNIWPVSYFKEVAEFLSENGYNIILIGGKEDTGIAEKLAYIKNTYNICGLLSPLETAVMLTYCNIVGFNDTGPMHRS